MQGLSIAKLFHTKISPKTLESRAYRQQEKNTSNEVNQATHENHSEKSFTDFTKLTPSEIYEAVKKMQGLIRLKWKNLLTISPRMIGLNYPKLTNGFQSVNWLFYLYNLFSRAKPAFLVSGIRKDRESFVRLRSVRGAGFFILKGGLRWEREKN